ncbi:hypothetical protein H6G96_06440 [Nostoc sp. FACHB-892]|uniref:hypothetical protein n=1 Tax=Nostoc sp. FACHB-892 TaxID=2692843 RepID=UPI0016889A99|nr:hypothetical protein [Nostoc sp. FACHB-892]MBD2725969.1 hypothetical protein [Nostoc sp. FACHB-892]
MISKIIKALTTDKEKNLQPPVEMEELSDGEAIKVVGGGVTTKTIPVTLRDKLLCEIYNSFYHRPPLGRGTCVGLFTHT